MTSPRIVPYPAYDPSAWEVDGRITKGFVPWTKEQLSAEYDLRLDAELKALETVVNYYRVGFTLSFPLRLPERPLNTPRHVIGRPNYPWLIWLAWRLEERWRILLKAWQGGHQRAGRLLQEELAALQTWDTYRDEYGNVSLVTGHLAACLSLALGQGGPWDPALYEQARTAAVRLLEQDVAPWYEKQWAPVKEFTPRTLVNIPFIALVRSAQLASVLEHDLAPTLNETARNAFLALCRLSAQEWHTEGTAYDGYLLDSITEWLLGLPDVDPLLAEGRAGLERVAVQWLHLILPGRADLHAPLGDVEPEMPFWTAALVRLAPRLGWADAFWLLRRFPVERFPAATLIEAMETSGWESEQPARPEPREHNYAITLRTGWELDDTLAVVGLSRCSMGHLQADGGQVLVGWHGRFWITDPGYQQYRPGLERNYTIGPTAHNAPVVGEVAQTIKSPRVRSVGVLPSGLQHCEVDLTECYEGLPEGMSLSREVWVAPEGRPWVVVRDRIRGGSPGEQITWHWHGGTHLAWSFVQDWARLSDGERSLWIGTAPGSIENIDLKWIEGTRGPLTLIYRTELPATESDQWWFFLGGEAGCWEPPQIRIEGDAAVVTWIGADGAKKEWTLGS